MPNRIYLEDNKIYFVDIETGAIKLLDVVKGSQSNHASRHESGGADEITGIDADKVDGIEGTVLKANEIIVMAQGFNIDGSSATLVTTNGTATKCYAQHISVVKTNWFDCPKFLVPADYDGGSIVITVCWRCAAASKKHSLGIRVASVPSGSPHNPDLAAAFQLYNEVVSDATIGDVTILSTTVTQAI